jgi:AcrR family transcriptional regulator
MPSQAKRSRQEVRAGQRVRLALAMIEAIAENGYRATPVADLVNRAGVSRKTFYELFANKQECLLVTFDMVAAEGMRRVEDAYRQADGWPDRVEAAIRALFEAAIANPGALRLSLLEIAAVGPAGIERRERSLVGYESFVRNALEFAPSEGAISDITLRALVGGLNGVLYRRLLGGDRDELLALVPELAAWAISYYPTPSAILREPQARPNTQRPARSLEGGRAPGTLVPHPRGGRRGLPRGDQNVSRSFVVHSQRERILDAVANLIAIEGYAELKVEAIAAQAAVSLNAFYEHFEDKEDAFLVAFEVGHVKSLAAVERAYAAEHDWRLGVRAGLGAMFEFFATEPSFAHIGLIDALVATPRTAERSLASVRAFAQVIASGETRASGQGPPPAVAVEAIAGGLFDLCLQYALQGRIHELPELTASATYIALAPFLGGEEAARVATMQPA